jgi:hypothetical protein
MSNFRQHRDAALAAIAAKASSIKAEPHLNYDAAYRASEARQSAAASPVVRQSAPPVVRPSAPHVARSIKLILPVFTIACLRNMLTHVSQAGTKNETSGPLRLKAKLETAGSLRVTHEPDGFIRNMIAHLTALADGDQCERTPEAIARIEAQNKQILTQVLLVEYIIATDDAAKSLEDATTRAKDYCTAHNIRIDL